MDNFSEEEIEQAEKEVDKFINEQTEYFTDIDESLKAELNEDACELFDIIKQKEQIQDATDRLEFHTRAVGEFIKKRSIEGERPYSVALPTLWLIKAGLITLPLDHVRKLVRSALHADLQIIQDAISVQRAERA